MENNRLYPTNEEIKSMLEVYAKLVSRSNDLGYGIKRFPNPFTRAKIAKEISDELIPQYKRVIPPHLRATLEFDLGELERRCDEAVSAVGVV